MSKKYKVFTFKDRQTQEVVYVGITSNKPENLLSHYKCESAYCDRPLCAWLKNNTPEIEVVKETDKWEDRQIFINKFSAKNSLLNIDKLGNEIYAEAGRKNRGIKRLSKESMISNLCKFYKLEGRFPISSSKNHRQGYWEYNDSFLCEHLKIHGLATYIYNFGSYRNACDLAMKTMTGDDNAVYENAATRGRKSDSKRRDRLIAAMVESKKRIGAHPHVIDKTGKWSDDVLNSMYGFSQQTYYKVFGSLTKLREEVDKAMNNE